jgi:hypothetical protein
MNRQLRRPKVKVIAAKANAAAFRLQWVIAGSAALLALLLLSRP